MQKLFEVYEINDELIGGKKERDFCNWIETNVHNYDLVIVADYGHGMMSPTVIELLCKEAPFLCVNAQGNAGNCGHNPISKYPTADCISLAQHELILEFRNQHLDAPDMVREISHKMNCQNVILTRGKYGTLCYRQGEEVQTVPAMAPKVVDRVGAGDAVLSVVSMALKLQAPLELIGLLGNAAGAEAVAIVGNKSSLEKIPYLKHLESLLK